MGGGGGVWGGGVLVNIADPGAGEKRKVPSNPHTSKIIVNGKNLLSSFHQKTKENTFIMNRTANTPLLWSVRGGGLTYTSVRPMTANFVHSQGVVAAGEGVDHLNLPFS